MEVIQWPTSGLRPHPKNEEIYGAVDPGDLVASIRDNGILNPLRVTADGMIICGHRRHAGAEIVGLDDVPVVVSDLTDEIDILNVLLQDNAHSRAKTKKQMSLEVAEIQRVEKVLAARRRADGWRMRGANENLPALVPEGSKGDGDVRQIVAERAGVGQHTADLLGHLARVVPTLPAEQQDQIWEVAEKEGVESAVRITPGLEGKARAAKIKNTQEGEEVVCPIAIESQGTTSASSDQAYPESNVRVGRRWYDRLTAVAQAIDHMETLANRRTTVKSWNQGALEFNKRALVAQTDRLVKWAEAIDSEIENRKVQGKW